MVSVRPLLVVLLAAAAVSTRGERRSGPRAALFITPRPNLVELTSLLVNTDSVE